MRNVQKILLLVCLLWLVPVNVWPHPQKNNIAFQQKIEELLQNKNVKAGVAVCFQGKMLCSVNATQSFPMMSVFKLHQAMAVLHRLQSDSLTLETPVLITEKMLSPHTYSPLRDTYPQGNIQMTIGELLTYSVKLSDNNASNILFNLFGGSQYVHQFIQDLGCKNTQIKWSEADMSLAPDRAYDNVTTPTDAAFLLESLMDARTDKHLYKDWLLDIMADTQTGSNRLAKYLPRTGVTLYHKTGTGYVKQDGTLVAVNDIGIVALPDGSHYFISVFCTESKMTMEETEELIAEISKLAYEYKGLDE